MASKPELFVVNCTPRREDEPWLSDLVAESREHFELVRASELDLGATTARTVVDIGGWAPNGAIRTAAEAGVGLWQVLGYGLDHIDVDFVLDQGLTLCRTPGDTTAVALAEHAMYLMLSLAKNVGETRTALERGEFSATMLGELAGKRLVVIGYGASGRTLAARAAGFGMRIDAVDIEMPVGPELDAGHVFADLDAALSGADVVSLHLPLTSHTHHLLDARRLSLLKPTATVINVARGALVDQVALTDALFGGRIAGVGLDVLEQEPPAQSEPLLRHPRAVLTPHVAALTRETSRRRAQVAVANALAFERGEEPRHVVRLSPMAGTRGAPGSREMTV